MSHDCLNCKEPLSGSFCVNCGQKASTHRYSLIHFIEHDLVHSIWHVDKGIFYTIKELFSRPGHSVRAFIEGKRVAFFPFVTLMILLIGAAHFLGELSSVKMEDLVPESSRSIVSELDKLSKKYPKLTMLFGIPIYSLFSYLWFRKAKLNGTEHIVLNTYRASGELIIGILFIGLTVFYHNTAGLLIVYSFVGILQGIYISWFYYQFFSVFGYTKSGLILRSILVFLSVFLFMIAIGIVAGVLKGMNEIQNTN